MNAEAVKEKQKLDSYLSDSGLMKASMLQQKHRQL